MFLFIIECFSQKVHTDIFQNSAENQGEFRYTDYTRMLVRRCKQVYTIKYVKITGVTKSSRRID